MTATASTAEVLEPVATTRAATKTAAKKAAKTATSKSTTTATKKTSAGKTSATKAAAEKTTTTKRRAASTKKSSSAKKAPPEKTESESSAKMTAGSGASKTAGSGASKAGTSTRKTSPSTSAADSGHNKSLGKRGEDAAARFLVNHGYTILARNYTCQFGEADIIAKAPETIVFVEVKTRTDEDKGMPEEAITEAKRNKYEKIAISYLRNYEDTDITVRFDVIGILVVAQDRAIIRHHINAFGVG